MYKLIICDLDETLLTTDKKITEKSVETIKKAMDMGVKFIPATGRGYTCIDDTLNALDLYDKEAEYVISNNGAIITENKEFRHLTFQGLTWEVAKQITEFGLAKKLCVQVFTARDIYTFNINEDEKKWLFMFKPDAILCEGEDFAFLEEMEIVKVMFQNTDIPYLQSLVPELSEEIRTNTTISYSSNRYMEFTANGISKGSALEALSKLLDVKLEEMIAIGDNHNDSSMLEVAGLSAAVGNALPHVKEMCDYVAENDNNHDAVAEIIEKFVLREK